MGLCTSDEFFAKHTSICINNEWLSYFEICNRVDKLVEDNYGKCKDGHFGFSMKCYKELVKDNHYKYCFAICNFYEKYLERIKYYENNLKHIKERKAIKRSKFNG